MIIIKKTTTILTVSFLLLFLFACEPKEDILNEPPYTFELVGESEVDIALGLGYNDSGVIAIDEDGLPLEYTLECDVVTNDVAVFECIYTLVDFDESLTRTVNVIDPEAPTMLRETISVGLGTEPIDFSVIDLIVNDNYDDVVTVEVIEDNINYNVEGNYNVTLKLSDNSGNEGIYTVVVSVIEHYTSGVYDFSNYPADVKSVMFAALESYLIETVTGGVPLYRSADFMMYSSRTELFTENHNGVFGFGDEFSSFTSDDSTVLMYDDVFGNAGEYTWRTPFNTEPVTLNRYKFDESATKEVIDLFTGNLYDILPDMSKTGFEIKPSMASDEPIAINSTIIDDQVHSHVWQIPLQDNLVWAFHPDIDVSGFQSNYTDLDASDFLWTWELALEQNWFRAIAGGGDFITQGVVNAEAFADGDVDFSEVGLRLAEGESNVLEIEFVNPKTAFEVKYMFSGSLLSPINQELYDSLGHSEYGQSPTTVASSGIYIFDSWTAGEMLEFKKNTSYPDSDLYHYTGIQYIYCENKDVIFDEFIAGRLDSTMIPADMIETYLQDSRTIAIPGMTTWRLNINGFGTVENRDEYIEQYPEFGLSKTYVPEPILGYLEMKQALYYGIDRTYLTMDIGQKYLPATTYFSSAYFLDNQSGMSVRGSIAGQEVYNQFTGDNNGYDFLHAKALFSSAVSKAILDGHYVPGTEENPTIIEIELTFKIGANTYLEAMKYELERQYEDVLYDEVNHIGIDIIHNEIPIYNSHYYPMWTASTDLEIAGISGRMCCSIDFFDVYRDDNVSGFTYNWGIDTHTPNIEVTYTNDQDVLVTELWSFNALSSAINGPINVENGIEKVKWEYIYDAIQYEMLLSDDVMIDYYSDDYMTTYVHPDLDEQVNTNSNIDRFESIIVQTESGIDILYVFSVKDGLYEIYETSKLYKDVFEAIEVHADYDLITIDGIITNDSEVSSNTYLSGIGISNYQQLLAEGPTGSEDFLEFYEVTWGSSYGGSDVYVVLHIGDYYLGYLWL